MGYRVKWVIGLHDYQKHESPNCAARLISRGCKTHGDVSRNIALVARSIDPPRDQDPAISWLPDILSQSSGRLTPGHFTVCPAPTHLGQKTVPLQIIALWFCLEASYQFPLTRQAFNRPFFYGTDVLLYPPTQTHLPTFTSPFELTAISCAPAGMGEVVTCPPGQRTQSWAAGAGCASTCTAASCDQ